MLLLIQFIFLGRLLFTCRDECQIRISMQNSSNSNKKSLQAKVLCQNLVVGAFFEADKNCSQMFFSQVKSEKSLIVIQSNTINNSIHPGVVATVLRFYLKCFSRGRLLKGSHNVHLHWRHLFLF